MTQMQNKTLIFITFLLFSFSTIKAQKVIYITTTDKKPIAVSLKITNSSKKESTPVILSTDSMGKIELKNSDYDKYYYYTVKISFLDPNDAKLFHERLYIFNSTNYFGFNKDPLVKELFAEKRRIFYIKEKMNFIHSK